MLAIKAVNITGSPLEISSVYVSFVYKSSLAEILFGRKTVGLPLYELVGKQRLPCVLQVGEAALWTANLRQLADKLGHYYLRGRHSRYLDSRSIDVDRWSKYGRLAIMVRNRIARWSSRELVVVVSDGRGRLHKATIRDTAPSWAVLRRRHFPRPVAEIDIFEDLLRIYPQGAEGVSLLLDLAHVTCVEADPQIARAALENSKGLDVGPPDVPTGPLPLPEGDTALFNVHDPEQAVVISLRNEHYSRLVIQVEDPTVVIAAIREAIDEASDSA